MNTLAAFRDLFIILGAIGVYVLLLGDVTQSGANAGEAFCGYLQENYTQDYQDALNTNPDINATCCAYDPNNQSCTNNPPVR